LDSSTPTKESNVYVVPFTVNTLGTTTVKAIGTKEGFVDSPVASTSFLLLEQAKMPTFIPNFGTFIDNATVHMSCETEGAAIRYTIDGSEPNAGSSQYNPNDGITVGLSEEGKEKVYILKAVAMKDTLGNSQTAVS
jgi:chitinase